MASFARAVVFSAAVGALSSASDSRRAVSDNDFLGYGFTASGRAFSLSTQGEVAFLGAGGESTQPRTAAAAAGACAVGQFFSSNRHTDLDASASNNNGNALFRLIRTNTSEDPSVHIEALSTSTGETLVQNELPFYAGDTVEDFIMGYDFYMDPCAACALEASEAMSERAGLSSASNETSRLLVTGPDEIQFIHMVTVEPALGKAHYNDLLQYSGGYRLARSASTFDVSRGEEWLQVVYDVSQEAEAVAAASKLRTSTQIRKEPVAPYLKRYDVATSAVLDVIPDIATTVAMEFDPKSKTIILVGDCKTAKKSLRQAAQSAPRCVYRIDPSTTANSSPNKAPKMDLVAELPLDHAGLMMGGISVLNPSSQTLYVVAERTANTTVLPAVQTRDPNDPALSCKDESQVRGFSRLVHACIPARGKFSSYDVCSVPLSSRLTRRECSWCCNDRPANVPAMPKLPVVTCSQSAGTSLQSMSAREM